MTYQLGEELGRGALGRVVRVTGGEVALAGKILHRSHRSDPRAVARLEAEARLLAAIQHPNLVGVHGLVEVDGERVLLMHLVEGESLATSIARDAPLDPARAAAIARGIAAGLSEAHRRGLVHRDLKPANVLVAVDGTPRIVDFGLARAAALTGVGAGDLVVVGTPAYMAPEALDPMAVDARSDLYALGCILFEMLTGRPPFDGATTVAVLEAHRDAPRPELPGAPVELARLVRWLLARSPADRPQSAAVVERALAERETLAIERVGGDGGCPACGAPVIEEVAVCFACRAPRSRAAPGEHTVFVTGPGVIGHKLDVKLRNRAVVWLRDSALGLSVDALSNQVPRVPFVVVTRIDEATAGRLVDGLKAIGLDAIAARGSKWALAEIRKKGKVMGGRYASIAVASVLPGLHSLGIAALPVAAVGALVTLAIGFTSASKPVCERLDAPPSTLPPPLVAALDRIAGVVPAIEEARHRDALRGVVERALALRAAVPPDEAARIAGDLARVLDLATVAASKLDELERGVDAASLHGGDADVRRRLQERDVWAGRLLEVTALLDALRARWAAARAAAPAVELDELRAQLDALDELRRGL